MINGYLDPAGLGFQGFRVYDLGLRFSLNRM